jgi:hypothetical protein
MDAAAEKISTPFSEQILPLARVSAFSAPSVVEAISRPATQPLRYKE